MKTYTVAVLGATGAVGQEMMKILEERNFPVGTLVPLASARSAGKTLKFRVIMPTEGRQRRLPAFYLQSGRRAAAS